MAHRFEIVLEIRREYRCLGTIGTQFTVRHNSPTDLNPNPVYHFPAIVKELFKHVLQDARDSDLVGVAIRNEVNQSDIEKSDLECFRKSIAVEFQIKCPRYFNYRSALCKDAYRFRRRWYEDER
jgi:hypothetical protein